MQTAALGTSTSTRQNLTIAALGVVYGDIGTSPLYAVRQCFHDAAAITMPRVFGVLSLIVWALTIIVTIKYVIVSRAVCRVSLEPPARSRFGNLTSRSNYNPLENRNNL